MAYEMVMPYHLHMPSYFLETFTEYPFISLLFVFHYSLTSQPNALAPNTAASASFNSEINNLVLPS